MVRIHRYAYAAERAGGTVPALGPRTEAQLGNKKQIKNNWLQELRRSTRAATDHIDILQHMTSEASPLCWALGPECEILVFM